MNRNELILKELLLSEEQLKAVLEGSQQGFWDWNISTGVVKRNDRWAQILGYSSINEFDDNTDTWTNLIHPDDRDAAWSSINDHVEGRTDCHHLEYRMLTKDGGYKWIFDQARIVKRDENGCPLRMGGTHIDISERKEAEEERNALFKSQQEALNELRAAMAELEKVSTHELTGTSLNDTADISRLKYIELFLKEREKRTQLVKEAHGESLSWQLLFVVAKAQIEHGGIPVSNVYLSISSAKSTTHARLKKFFDEGILNKMEDSEDGRRQLIVLKDNFKQALFSHIDEQLAI